MCVGIPARVCRIDGGIMPQAIVDVAGELRSVCVAYVPDAEEGDYVLIQNGFAMTVMDAESARESLDAIRELAAASGCDEKGGSHVPGSSGADH